MKFDFSRKEGAVCDKYQGPVTSYLFHQTSYIKCHSPVPEAHIFTLYLWHMLHLYWSSFYYIQFWGAQRYEKYSTCCNPRKKIKILMFFSIQLSIFILIFASDSYKRERQIFDLLLSNLYLTYSIHIPATAPDV